VNPAVTQGKWGVLAQLGFAEESLHEQALVSLKLKKTVDAEVGRTFAIRIEGG